MSNKQEKRRLDRLKKELDSQQKKLDTEKKKYLRQMKELKAEQAKVASQKRELNTKIKKFDLNQRQRTNSTARRATKTSINNNGIENKLRAEIASIKSKSEKTKKSLRENRKDLDAAKDEIKILKRKLKHGGNQNNSNMNERKFKRAQREIVAMRRRLKIAIKDMDKQQKYYENLLRRFKQDEQKWINRQREIKKDKDVLIKYVFVDDIQKLKVYKNDNDKARITIEGGAECVVRDIEVTEATDYDIVADDVLDKIMQEIEFEHRSRKKRKYSTKTDVQNDTKSVEKSKKKKEQNESENEEVDLKSFDDIYDDVDEEEDFIDKCFLELMKEIDARTRDLITLNEEEDERDELLQNIQQRHTKFEEALNGFNYDYADELSEMSKNWQDAIYKLLQNESNENENVSSDVLRQRNEILLKMIAVLHNEQPKELLDEILANSQNEKDENWKNVLIKLGKMRMNDYENKKEKEEISSNELSLCNEYLNEMELRTKDLENVRFLYAENENEPLEEADNILDAVKKRHTMQNDKISQIMNESDAEMIKTMKNNQKWEEELLRLINENKENVLNKKQKEIAEDELNGRIADLLKLMQIFNQTKSTKVDINKLKNDFNSFVHSIKDRHTFNHENNPKNIEAIENDKDWMDNIFALASNISGLKVKDVSNENDDNEEDDDESKENEADWWLDADANRNETIDGIAVSEQQSVELFECITYFERLLYMTGDEKEDENDVITCLYFPVPSVLSEDDENEPNVHNIVATLYDGVCLCKLINKIRSEYIDERVIHTPNAFNPFPINDDAVFDNMRLVISCVQSLGIQLKSYDLDKCMDAANWCSFIIDLVNALSVKYLSRRIGLHKNKELVRLVKNNEDADEIKKLSGTQWLYRWLNYMNNKPVLDEINAQNVNNEICAAMKINVEQMDDNEAANALIEKYKNVTNVTAKDVLNGHSKCLDLLCGDLFEFESGLNKLSNEEKTEFKSLLKSSSKSKSNEDRFTNWINTALSPNVTIVNLLKDLSSGYILLKICDKSKPGCVQWRNVRKKIRHKFDKVNNCNLVMQICESFDFSLVGMAGSDIVEMNQKFVHSLLSQLMRYYATRQLSMVLFKNATQKTVSDADILQWVNLKIAECEEAQSKPVSSFKDRVLSTCIMYIELLKAVRPNDVDLALCNYEVKPLVGGQMDKQKVERTQNAKYCMSMIRRLGGELFVSSYGLCSMDNKAVLAVFAAIMTIAVMDEAKK